MNIVVCIASHERHRSLQVVLDALPIGWQAVVVLSPHEDAAPISMRPDTHVFHFPNEPLGLKWQHAVDRARELNPDAIVITGSDDVLLVDPLELYEAMDHVDMLGLRAFTAYDGTDHYHCVYREGIKMPIGSGRVYKRGILDRMRWKLFDTTKEKHLDELGYHNAMRCGARVSVQDLHPGWK